MLIRLGGKTVTTVVEVNGAPFHTDQEKERQRNQLLGVPILHLDAGRLDEPRLIERILSWARRVAEAA